jgi:hypothetical protein
VICGGRFVFGVGLGYRGRRVRCVRHSAGWAAVPVSRGPRRCAAPLDRGVGHL